MALRILYAHIFECHVGNVEDVVVVRYLVTVEESAELCLNRFLDSHRLLVLVQNPELAHYRRELVLAVSLQQLAAQTAYQQTVFHIVIVCIRHVAEHQSRLGQHTDTFFCNLIVNHISWHQCIHRIGTLAVAAGGLGHWGGERVLAVVARVDHRRTVVIYTNVAQLLVTLRADEHTTHIIGTFRSHVGAGEVVDDVLNLQVRTTAVGTALRVEQMAVVALRAEVLLDEVVTLAQCAAFHHTVLEGEHFCKMKEAHAVIVLEDRVDVSQRRFLHQSVPQHSLVSG